jgi:cytochrome o ubiquinol oxidase subunit IV
MIDPHSRWNVSFKPQFLGFVFSIILTLAAYRIVTHYHLTNLVLIVTLFSIGISQALVQLIFFLHLSLESKPRWNLITFLFMVLIVFVVIGGSLWIMYNLSYNLMPA